MKKRYPLLASILGVTTLSGLAACGDNTSGISFNRIEDAVLSLISMPTNPISIVLTYK